MEGKELIGIGRLHGKVAVITGAASGIGRQSALRFAAEGARVCVVDLADGAGEEVAGEIDGLYVHADVTDQADVERAYEETAARFGGIDVLFNNAGISPPDDASILDTTLEAWQRVQDVNLKAVFLCCKHGIPHLLRRGGGAVVNTAS
ncbi:MAG TPA: SDR family NAD(P)-dependent oxidoreductase, partial [Actinomycetota bacterium]|nr:SDR family NAD(P)-dependent oxidoreductase [Actinomycetota bacterium]